MSADREAAEAALRAWKQMVDARDRLIGDALAAGVTINRIHTLTGISRSTIYRVLETHPKH
ncbi:helix-turn-helix domain-containing protein [Gordonia amicalis]|uniref:helix-turn-helix domain-containing protein n=1 Tax=Gordonia amicalis TaxID=89053 RepID=UPI0022B44132|nr:helix-turn-helix domain-containing protein [Gordonia amicalis]MCZ4581725.1 helix-turn-helix domain-containing protein [Gordonia amicalis]